MNDIAECGRCGSKIVESPNRPTRLVDFTRYPDHKSHEVEAIKLCSLCLDDIWEFVFETEVDRSDKADPVPIAKLNESVSRHIEDLEGVLDELEVAKSEGLE